MTAVAEAQGYSAVPFNLDVSRGVDTLNAQFVLTSGQFAESGDASGPVDKITSVTLNPDITGAANGATAVAESHVLSGELQLVNDYPDQGDPVFWTITVDYKVSNTVVAQRDEDDFSAQPGFAAQSPVASSVLLNDLVTIVTDKQAVIGGKIFPQASDDDFSIVDAYAAYLPVGIYYGVDYRTEASAGGQDSSGIAGGIGGAFRGAAQAGDRFEVADTSVTTDFVPAYEDAWFTGEKITLIPSLGGAGNDTEYHWNGTVWAAGPATLNNFPDVVGFIDNTPAESALLDSSNGTVLTAGWRGNSTLSRIRAEGLGTKRWAKDAFIVVLEDDGITPQNVYWTGSGWAPSKSPGYQPMYDPLENDLSGLPGEGAGGGVQGGPGLQVLKTTRVSAETSEEETPSEEKTPVKKKTPKKK